MKKNFSIEPTTKKDLPDFVECLISAFNDKFPIFFRYIPKNKYKDVMINLLWDVRNKKKTSNPLEGSYVIKEERPDNLFNESTDYNFEVVGAFRFITNEFQEEPWLPGWKALNKHLSLFQSLRAGYWLQALGQKSVGKEEIYIDSIGVLPDHQGKGIGTMVFSFLEKYAFENGKSSLSLYVSAKNPRAKKLYERIGLEVIKKQKIPFSRSILKIPFYYYMKKQLKRI